MQMVTVSPGCVFCFETVFIAVKLDSISLGSDFGFSVNDLFSVTSLPESLTVISTFKLLPQLLLGSLVFTAKRT